MRPNVDVARAVGLVLATEARIAELIPEIEEQLPGFDAELIEELRPLALAAGYANAIYAPPHEVTPTVKLVAEAKPLRRLLLKSADALAEAGLLEWRDYAPLRLAKTNRMIANHLIALAHLFRENWQAIEGKTAVTEETVDRAATLGMQLLEGLGTMDVAPAPNSEIARAADARARAFTLLAKTYDQVRRAVTFLRWNEQDAEDIAPSFYHRGSRRPAAPVEPAASEAPAAPPAPIGSHSAVPRSMERAARSGTSCAPIGPTRSPPHDGTPVSGRRGTARSASFIESRRRRGETVENRRSKSSTSP